MPYLHIDELHVTGLIRELTGDVAACVKFIEGFVRAWDERIARILDAVDRDDPDEAMAALLSLYSSSAMIGAKLLSREAKELHAEIRMTRRFTPGAVSRLANVGSASCAELIHLARKWEKTLVTQ
jgi:HPt (histidine-containing phosphotransfer) domain-containing protein